MPIKFLKALLPDPAASTHQNTVAAIRVLAERLLDLARPPAADLDDLSDAVDDLREALDQPLNRWLRGDKKRISALLDGRFDELVDLAVNRAPFPRREIGTSVYEGVAEYVETPIIRSGGPLVTEDVEDGFAR